MKKILKRLCTGFLALATIVTALPSTAVHAESKQYWTESEERVGIVEKVMNDGSIGFTFNEGHLTVEGEDAYCIDINTDFKNGYKTRADASVDADTVNDATAFLETFFKLYPTATAKELAYYVFGNVLEPIGKDYLYSELVNPVFTKDGDNMKVKVAVKFLDNQTKATQVLQYELILHKDSN